MSSHHTPSTPLSTTSPSPSPSPNHISDDEKPSPGSVSPPPPPATRPVFLSREDCWSEDATRTLIDAWGSHYLQLNRGNLRHNHWQAVADVVNATHATTPKHHRSDIQCKNRIDTIKKKYKIEKSKTFQSDGRYLSTWPHFQTLDPLIGDSFSKHNHTTTANRPSRYPRRQISPSPESSPSPPHPSTALARDVKSFPSNLPRVPWSVPVGPRSKRSGYGSVTKRNFSVMAAAAAAIEAGEGEMSDDEDSGAWAGRLLEAVGQKMKRRVEEEGKSGREGGCSRLAEAVARLGKIYEKVELEKQHQIVELEKQRMQFFKDLEIQRIKIFMESQVQLVKLKRAKHHSENNSYL